MFKNIIMVLLVTISLIGYNPQRTVAEEPQIILTIEQHIQHIFGSKAQVATAVLKHESGLSLKSINYNCRYKGKSKSCKKGDENKAWSVDCGIAQINVKGKYCPKSLFTLEGNMEAVEKIYNTQGLNAWVSYKTGAYKKYL